MKKLLISTLIVSSLTQTALVNAQQQPSKTGLFAAIACIFGGASAAGYVAKHYLWDKPRIKCDAPILKHISRLVDSKDYFLASKAYSSCDRKNNKLQSRYFDETDYFNEIRKSTQQLKYATQQEKNVLISDDNLRALIANPNNHQARSFYNTISKLNDDNICRNYTLDNRYRERYKKAAILTACAGLGLAGWGISKIFRSTTSSK